jgi:molybdenum cofactor biosynthesis enzyme MoaA
MNPFFYNIDILGACNLACPSCPQGNAEKHLLPRGRMSLDLFKRILDKAQAETLVTGIGLFNWTEPLLHPDCAAFVAEVRRRGLECHLSTNCNRVEGIEDCMDADVTSIRISVSGWWQESYQRTHRGGDIGKVRKNMYRIYAHLHHTNGSPRINVLWHRYKHNHSERHLMKRYVESLGFHWQECEAYLMPLELVISRWRHATDQLEIERNLITPLDIAQTACEEHKAMPCRLQTREVTIDAAGGVHLCCALYDPAKSAIGDFLSQPIEALQRRKYQSSVCSKCLAAGGHAYATFLWKRKERWLSRLGNWRAKLLSWKNKSSKAANGMPTPTNSSTSAAATSTPR